MAVRRAEESIARALEVGKAKVGIDQLKPQQEAVIRIILQGHDVFAALPTGYGKSYCYAMLPHIYDSLRGKKDPASR